MPSVDDIPAGAPLVVRYTEVFLRGRYDGGFWLSGTAAAFTIIVGAITLGYSTFGGLALAGGAAWWPRAFARTTSGRRPAQALVPSNPRSNEHGRSPRSSRRP
jgi:hypothetical protein